MDTEEEERILKEKWAALKARKKQKKAISKKTFEEEADEIDPQMKKLKEIEKRKKA